MHTIPSRNRIVVERDVDTPANGVMRFLDVNDAEVGQLAFADVAAASPCFTPGTMIATPHGEVAVENLMVGDRVITRDNGLQVIRWIGQRPMTAAMFGQCRHLAPVRIRKGALGNDLPERDMMISPNHRMLVANDKTALHFDETEVLVAAKHLTGLAGVDRVYGINATYLHLMFDRHEVILADGAWSESFQPDVPALIGIGNAQRLEVLEIFPKLATADGIKGYCPARRVVHLREIELLK